jgi:hypothetical protein
MPPGNSPLGTTGATGVIVALLTTEYYERLAAGDRVPICGAAGIRGGEAAKRSLVGRAVGGENHRL